MTLLALLALLAWIYLYLLHGQFWQSGPELAPARPATAVPVDIIVPARGLCAPAGGASPIAPPAQIARAG